MIVPGYYGKLVITNDLTSHCVCWFASMAFFLYIVYKLLVGLSAATASEANPRSGVREVGSGGVEGKGWGLEEWWGARSLQTR